MMQTSYNTWGWSKDITLTTWGANWDTCSVADHVVIALDPNPCYIQEVSIIINKGNGNTEQGQIRHSITNKILTGCDTWTE